jgi:ATP-binding cassette subfamily B protein
MSTSLRTIQIYTSEWLKHPILLLGSFLMVPASVLQVTISPLLIAQAVNQLTSGQPVNATYMILAAASLVGGAVIAYISDRFFLTRMSLAVTHSLHQRCLKHLLKQDYAFFADSFAGSLVAQASRFAKGHDMFAGLVFLELLGPLCSILIALGIMIAYNPIIGLLIGVVWSISAFAVAWLTKRRMPYRRHAVAAESQQTGLLADIIANAMTVKSFAQEKAESRRYNELSMERVRRYAKSWHVAINNTFIINMLTATLTLIVFIGGIMAVQRGTLSLATFLLFNVYVVFLISKIDKFTNIARQIEGILGDAHEMTELLECEPHVKDPVNPEPSRIHKGEVELRNVQFSYGDGKNVLLDNFNLRVRPGEKVGLVGPSGGGKSTLIKLLLRFIDVQSGAVLIDGQDIRSITQADLHNAISYVPQEPLLFHRSIRENIAYGQPDLTEKDIIEAAKQAHAHEFIKDLPDGYDTLVGERGVKLSGGQRQRIAIARAILKNAPILVLDEATSALDSESEKHIQAALWELMKQRTAIVIAHRLSTIQKMDRIIVLDNGNIIEQGTHTELLRKGGTYADLWAHQSGGFIEE